jgi:HTH-like domain/Integrase core domain
VLTAHGVPIAPRTFYAWAVRAPSKRALWDATITEVLAGYYEPDEHGRRKPESLYGSVKMWAHLQREGIPVAKSTVERLMRRHGWQGVRRQKSVRTTIADPSAVRPPDLVDRQFGVDAPNRLLVADFTYVKLITGVFVYVAFVIDAYAGAILGWEASASKQTRFVESAIRQAAALRSGQGHPLEDAIHHSDAGSQGGFNGSSQHLDLSEVFYGVREAAVRGSWLSGADSLAGPPDGGLAPRSSPVLGGHRGGSDDRGRSGGGRRVVAGRVPLVPARWRCESTFARDCFGVLPVLGRAREHRVVARSRSRCS